MQGLQALIEASSAALLLQSSLSDFPETYKLEVDSRHYQFTSSPNCFVAKMYRSKLILYFAKNLTPTMQDLTTQFLERFSSYFLNYGMVDQSMYRRWLRNWEHHLLPEHRSLLTPAEIEALRLAQASKVAAKRKREPSAPPRQLRSTMPGDRPVNEKYIIFFQAFDPFGLIPGCAGTLGDATSSNTTATVVSKAFPRHHGRHEPSGVQYAESVCGGSSLLTFGLFPGWAGAGAVDAAGLLIGREGGLPSRPPAVGERRRRGGAGGGGGGPDAEQPERQGRPRRIPITTRVEGVCVAPTISRRIHPTCPPPPPGGCPPALTALPLQLQLPSPSTEAHSPPLRD
jgi:hypothetical protein